MTSSEFSFRWGVDLFDDQRTPVPNWVLANYHHIEWQSTDEEGNPIKGVGISNTEMMFIIHLASFRYESERGQASPSLTGTLAERMNYKSNQGIINVEQGLIEKGLLLVEKRSGKTSVYDFTPFSQAIITVIEQNDPSTKLDGSSSTKVDASETEGSIKVDGSRQQKLTQRKEEKENPEMEGEEKNRLAQFGIGEHPPTDGLAPGTDGFQLAVDAANGAQEDPVKVVARHLHQGFMEAPVPLPNGKRERKKWLEAGRRLLARLPSDWELRAVCEAIDYWWHQTPKADRFWRDKPCKDETLDLIARYHLARQERRKDSAASIEMAENATRTEKADYEVLWRQTLADLRGQMTQATFDAWLKGTEALERENGRLVVAVRSEAARDWLTHRLGNVVARTLASLSDEAIEVVYQVA